ncbi:lactonase family protein [Rhodoplanes sp. Z2-YC6860]|uniref:lactonase family protein n=1 Tax=Rhodoplanes sp. Z2-YC6860 TaxID=674703 RepID=UPI00078E5B7F|nr:beta-propeller fold lactonase family protein [Rhodoplanes sp. Z2-YC6860]AMN41660.1 6-phosphogluconolactonase [Rhodoplanes sp. Z2-YC6860]
MKAQFLKAQVFAIMMSLDVSSSVTAGTFVYVSNADDGDIGIYAAQADGSLKPGQRFKAAKLVMPMAVSPDKRFLIAAARSKPYQAHSFSIDKASGALNPVGAGPLAESYPYITFDRTGRFLLGASYGAHQVGVNPVGADGKVGEPIQVIPTARNAHSIRIDNTNRFVFVPHLGTDQVFQFVFDETTGRLTANTPPVLQLKQGTGPRHIVVSADNRFAYLLSEMVGTVTTLALDASTGALKEIDSVSVLPADTKLGPGLPRGAVGAPGAPQRNTDNDIWASDLHLTPNGRFLYAAERTSSTIAAFRVDQASGKLTYLGSTPTEKQPRGFNIDPAGRFVVVSGELSDMIASYAIDADTGVLKPVGRYPTGKGSNWVEIVAFE